MANSSFMLARKLLVLIAVSTTLSGCGYHTAGKAVRIPASVQTVAIPAFVNQTQTYRIEQTMTAAVVKEFVSRTRFQVNNTDGADSDAVLKGTITATQFAPLTYDSTTGRASSALVTVNLKVTLTDKQGKILFENPN